MAPGLASTAAALRTHLGANSSIKVYTPDSPEFGSVKQCYIERPEAPFAIARPQSADDVQTLVTFCLANDIDFLVRSAGHDCIGRTQVQDVLTIDMRDMHYVVADESKTTARVGGGTTHHEVAAELGKLDLVTPIGTIASVGYVGWATLGGYGPFSPAWGLGVDQIVGAKLVNAKGELVDTDRELLKGLRGGGGIFGVIAELVVKVYPMDGMTYGLVAFSPDELNENWQAFGRLYNKLVEEGLPAELNMHAVGLPLPSVGNVLGFIVAWRGRDLEEANKWVDRLVTLGTPILRQLTVGSVAEYAAHNEKLLTYGVHGRLYSLNFRKYTPTTTEILAKYSAHFPAAEAGLSIHALRAPKENDESVFGSRTSHFVLEIMAISSDASRAEDAARWAESLRKELREGDPTNICEDSYMALVDDAEADYRKIYGRHYDTLLELKKKYDPENVFQYAVPRIATPL